MTFWVIAAVVAVVLLAAWWWADRHQPGGPDGNRPGDDAAGRGRVASALRRNDGSGPRGL